MAQALLQTLAAALVKDRAVTAQLLTVQLPYGVQGKPTSSDALPAAVAAESEAGAALLEAADAAARAAEVA